MDKIVEIGDKTAIFAKIKVYNLSFFEKLAMFVCRRM